MSDTFKVAANKLEDAVNNVARAASELLDNNPEAGNNDGRKTCVVNNDDLMELRAARSLWNDATQELLAATVKGMNEPKKTMKELCHLAITVQDASNLSGVVHSFSEVMRDLRLRLEMELGCDFSTDKLNRHPVCVMFSSKIASLTGSESGLDFSKAYDFCKKEVGQ